MKIAFYASVKSFFGTDISTFKLASALRNRLGLECVCLFVDGIPENSLIKTLLDSYPTLSFEFSQSFDNPERLASYLEDHNFTFFYFQLGTQSIPDLFEKIKDKLLVHCVTQTVPIEGVRFAYTAKWLSDTLTGGLAPFVPYVVALPKHNFNLRSQLGIPEDSVVFGRIGGGYSWNIRFVDQVIGTYCRINPNARFVFVNTPRLMPYMDVPNAIFLGPIIHNENLKRAFINTCDAMIHARSEGETFGLACGEFVFCGKPVITYEYSPEAAHLEMLGDYGLTYSSPHSLSCALSLASLRQKKFTQSYYLECSEEFVVKKFVDWITI
jgi:hypothetical protein